MHALDDKRLSVPAELARSCVDMTRPVWTQGMGPGREPLDQAYRRLIGRDVPASLLVAALVVEGRMCTAHVVPGGVVLLWDPHTGWQIRTLTSEGRRASDKAANVAAELASVEQAPLTLLGGRRVPETGRELADAGGDWLRGLA